MIANNVYCRFENFCFNFDLDNTTTVREKSLYNPDEDVYVENFTNIASLKTRVLELYEIWINKRKLNDKQEYTYYPGFIIFHQYGDSKTIGFCPLGWHFFNGGFANYIRNYLIALDYDRYPQNLRKIEGRGCDFNVGTEDYGDDEMNFLSDELMDLELEYFLEGKEITEKIKQEVFYPEMVRRGYVDILDRQ